MENKVGISAADRGMICPLCGRSAGEHEIAVTPTATGLQLAALCAFDEADEAAPGRPTAAAIHYLDARTFRSGGYLHGEKAGLPSAADLDADAAEKQVGDDTK